LNGEDEVQETLKLIQQATDARKGHKEPGWLDVLCPTDPVVKAAAFVGLGLGFWQQATGSEAAVYYSPTVLEDAGITSRGPVLLGTCLVGCFKLGGELIAMSLLDTLGRRPLFITSAVLSTVSLLTLAIALLEEWSAAPTLAALCMFMASFSIGIGPLTFVVAAEIFPLHVRGQAVSIAVFINRFLSGAIALSYLSMANALTPAGSFFTFAAISAISVIFYMVCVPETKGKTLEQIAHDLAAEFHLKDPQWAAEQSGLRNVRTYPSSDRLVSVLSSQRLVSALSVDDLTSKGRIRRSSSSHSIY
jgi:MFS family permease